MPGKASSKPAGKMKIKAGSSGGMHKFSGVGPQKADQTAVTQHKGKGASFAKGGKSGGMHNFDPVKPQKSGRSGQG